MATVSPIFAIIMVRDTTQIPQCDTIIENNGNASPVKILSVGNAFITYKQCGDDAKKIYTIEVSKVQDIKSKTFTFEKPEPITLEKRAKRGFIFSIVSGLVILLSLFILFETGAGILAYFIYLISPFVLLGSLIHNIILRKKAKKTGDKKAMGYTTGRFIAFSLTILIALKIIFQED